MREPHASKNILIIASILMGTILEWYDFSLLGSMAAIISHVFFPTQKEIVSLLAIFSIFASGFLARPIGGVIFGHIGDCYGRRTALSLSIVFMALPTTLIGFLPTFTTVGIVAPFLLVLLRLFQGISSSGEYPGAICFLAEISPPNKRGLWSSISMFGVVGGVLLGSIVCTIVSSYLSNEQMYSWGWRIPFLIGLPLGIIGWYLRYKVKESEIFISAKLAKNVFKLPIIQIFKKNFFSLNKVILLFSLSTISFYIGFVYMPTYLIKIHRITFNDALYNNTLSTLVLILSFPVFGYISDRINRKLVIFTGASCLLIFFYPIFILFLSNTLYGLLIGQILLALFIGMFASPLAAAATEMFSTLTRYSGISSGLNIGASIFGGTTPLIATSLAFYSENEIIPCLYPILFSLICLVVTYTLEKNEGIHLNTN